MRGQAVDQLVRPGLDYRAFVSTALKKRLTRHGATSAEAPGSPVRRSRRSGSASRHSAADLLDWNVQSMTDAGLRDALIPQPSAQECASISNHPEVTREDFKKNLGLIKSLKKMFTNLSSTLSCRPMPADYDYLQQQLRFFEARAMGI